MASRRVREKMRLRRIAHDKLVEESRRKKAKAEEEPKPKKKPGRKPKKSTEGDAK